MSKNVTAAVNSKPYIERTLEEFRGFTGFLSNAKEKGIVNGTGAWNKGDVKNVPVMKQAFDMGLTI